MFDCGILKVRRAVDADVSLTAEETGHAVFAGTGWHVFFLNGSRWFYSKGDGWRLVWSALREPFSLLSEFPQPRA